MQTKYTVVFHIYTCTHTYLDCFTHEVRFPSLGSTLIFVLGNYLPTTEYSLAREDDFWWLFFKLGVKEVSASLPPPCKQVHDLTTVNGFLSLGTLTPWVSYAKTTVNLCCLQPGTLSFYLNLSRKTISKLSFKHAFKKMIQSFLAAVGLCCWAQAFTSCSKWGLLSRCNAQGFPCGGFSHCGVWAVFCMGSVVVAHRFSCSVACRIFPDQGLNQCLLHCKQTLNHWTIKEAPFWHLENSSNSISCEDTYRGIVACGKLPKDERGTCCTFIILPNLQ